MDCAHWFDDGPVDADCRHWLPYMSAEDLALDHPKLCIEHLTGALKLSFPMLHANERKAA